MRSLPPAEVAIASFVAFSLWALQTRSWRRPELYMKTARIKSTNQASRIGATTSRRGSETSTSLSAVDTSRKASGSPSLLQPQASIFTTRHINLKTAKALGIELPTSILLRATLASAAPMADI